MKRLNNKIIIVIVAAAVVLILFLASFTTTQRENISGVESAARDASAPLKSGVTSLMAKFSNIPRFFADLDELTKENEELKAQIASLKSQVNSLNEAKTENIYLKEMLNITEELSDWTPVASTVIARSSKSWYSTITIKGGKNQGFEKDMPVITPQGLVGRIIMVSNNTAEVLLIIDQECATSAMVQPSQTPGVVEGNAHNSDTLYMIHIPADAKINKDQSVITSGLGGIFPRGLRIGYITDVYPVQGNLMLQATIEPFVDFDRITNVLVLTTPPKVDPEELMQNMTESNIDSGVSGS
ncbi:MAG: rod shape-determining protein MreC [Bacillota bacterium]